MHRNDPVPAGTAASLTLVSPGMSIGLRVAALGRVLGSSRRTPNSEALRSRKDLNMYFKYGEAISEERGSVTEIKMMVTRVVVPS